MKHLIITLICLLGAAPALAETRYVTDIFQITLRSGKSTQNEIIRMLPSGTALKVLESDPSAGYTRVTTPGGADGWVLSRYLMDLPSARARLTRAKTRLANLEQEMNKLKAEYKAMSSEKGKIGKERKSLHKQNLELSNKLAKITRISSNAIQLNSENERMKKQLAESDREIQFLQQENANLQDRSHRDWFIVGALVVVLSMIFGIILTRIRWQKKSSWGDI